MKPVFQRAKSKVVTGLAALAAVGVMAFPKMAPAQENIFSKELGQIVKINHCGSFQQDTIKLDPANPIPGVWYNPGSFRVGSYTLICDSFKRGPTFLSDSYVYVSVIRADGSLIRHFRNRAEYLNTQSYSDILDPFYHDRILITPYLSYPSGEKIKDIFFDTYLTHPDTTAFMHAMTTLDYGRFHIVFVNSDLGLTVAPDGKYGYQFPLTLYAHYQAFTQDSTSLNIFIAAVDDYLGTATFELCIDPGATAVREDARIPMQISQLYPNPTSAGQSTTLLMTRSDPANLHITLYNVRGIEVAKLWEGQAIPNTAIGFAVPSSLPAGTYFYRVEASGENGRAPLLIEQKPIVILK